MITVDKLKGTIRERRQQDDTAAALEKLAANQDYICMMTDVELASEEDEMAESEVE